MTEQGITFAAVGDIALTHAYDKLLPEKGPDYPFEKVKDIFKEKDIVFGNLEAPLSEKGKTYPLKCSLRSQPAYISGIKSAGFNIISLANNHILDYGEDAFYDTLAILKRHGIRYVGAGANFIEARRPAILEIRKLKVGFLGYCDVVIDSPFYATSSARGIAPLKMEYVEKDIDLLKDRVDFVIVSLHWGVENWSHPSPDQIRSAHNIIDYGANLILGHHPHVVQGIEKYRSGVIVYSLGNFVFSDISWCWTNNKGNDVHSSVRMSKKNRETVIFSAELTKHGIGPSHIVPCFVSENLQTIPERYPAAAIRNIERLSKRLYLKNYGIFWHCYVLYKKLTAAFERYCRRIRKVPRFAIRILKRAF